MRFNNVNSVALEQRKLELEKDKIYLSSNEKKYGRLLSEMGRYGYCHSSQYAGKRQHESLSAAGRG